jgi:hypothetical protein
VAPRGALRRGAVERAAGRRDQQRPGAAAVGGHRAVLRCALRPRRDDGEALESAGLAAALVGALLHAACDRSRLQSHAGGS